MKKIALLAFTLTASFATFAHATADSEPGKAADKTTAAAKKGGRKVKNAAKDATNKTGEGMEKAGDKMQDATKK